jgi:hypothetical protein
MIATIIDFIAWLFEKPKPEAKRTPDIVPYRDADHAGCCMGVRLVADWDVIKEKCSIISTETP